MSANDKKLAIIGCGNLGSALATRLATLWQVSLYDKDHDKARELASKVGATAYDELSEAIHDSDLIFLVIKPADLPSAARDIIDNLPSHAILASALAMTSLEQLRQHLGGSIPLLRFMPNIACAFGDSAIALCDGNMLTLPERQLIDEMFSSLGTLYWVEESLMPACVSLIGSTPAFLFVIVEALVDAAIAMGFPAPMAQQLVQQVCSGALTTLKETKLHPAVLKWQVASPAGTTIAGLATLEYHGLRNALIQTLLATHKRALE